MGAETSVHNKLVEVRGFEESDRGRFDEVVLGGWIRGEDVEASGLVGRGLGNK